MRIFAWGRTDVGRKRDHNEDSFLLCPDLGLFAVADGMGGHAGGDRASRMAVEILEQEVRQTRFGGTMPLGAAGEATQALALREAARRASAGIHALGETDPQLGGMGTTLTAVLIHGGRAYLAHVGDSRAYLHRDDKLEQLTDDHSWIEEQVRAGLMSESEAQESSLRHTIWRARQESSHPRTELCTCEHSRQ